MILPELFLPTRVNLQLDYSGLDCYKECLNKKHFETFPYPVSYQYNSRGFRDCEWPDCFDTVIWCIGDSFTVGLGSPWEHTWPRLLQHRTNRRTINVSMDAASNHWISRMALAILNQFPRANVVVHWSYQHRGEASVASVLPSKFQNFYNKVRDPSWPNYSFEQFDLIPPSIQKELIEIHGWKPMVYDDERVAHFTKVSLEDELVITKQLIEALPQSVIQTSIPHWRSPENRHQFEQVIETPQLDLARDGHHYDIKTAAWLVDKIMSIKNLQAD